MPRFLPIKYDCSRNRCRMTVC